jgi:hypothetical protein
MKTKNGLTHSPRACNICELPSAEVAELVDALVSGTSARKGVRVQISSSAPEKAIFCNLNDACLQFWFWLEMRFFIRLLS